MANATILVKPSGEGYKYSVKFCICGILSGGGHGRHLVLWGRFVGKNIPTDLGMEQG
jgi:hypothetical protein